MKMILRPIVILTSLALTVAACDDEPVEVDPGPYTLTFEGDASFQGAHGGQPIQVAVLSESDGAVVARDEGTVSGSAAPAFSFTFPDLLEADESYRVHYWVDSNFGGGTATVCDEPSVDHQWNVPIGMPEGDVTHTEEHRPAETASVCPSFSSTLVFRGDATFQGAHGGQDIRVAILDADGTVLGRATGVVSADADPSFSFEFPGLPRDGEFRAHYWIDSNFGGGTAGTCDPPGIDHQWDVSIGTLTGAVTTVTEDHRPGETTDVCATFP